MEVWPVSRWTVGRKGPKKIHYGGVLDFEVEPKNKPRTTVRSSPSRFNTFRGVTQLLRALYLRGSTFVFRQTWGQKTMSLCTSYVRACSDGQTEYSLTSKTTIAEGRDQKRATYSRVPVPPADESPGPAPGTGIPG